LPVAWFDLSGAEMSFFACGFVTTKKGIPQELFFLPQALVFF
jgi:hypothetical protein